MTYPTRILDALGADGAFEIGGGDANFGQDHTEEAIRNLFKVPAPTLGNYRDLLREQLQNMPLESLRSFRDLLPDVLPGDFDNVHSAVDRIMASFQDGPAYFRTGDWQEFLDRIKGSVGGTVDDVVDKFDATRDEAVQRIKDQLTGVTNATDTHLDDWLLGLLTGESELDASKIIGRISQDRLAIPNVQDIVDRIVEGGGGSGVGNAVDTIRDRIGNIFNTATTAKTEVTALDAETAAAQENLQNFTIATQNTSRNPAWVSRYPIADVSYPEALNMMLATFNTSGGVTGTAQAALYGVAPGTALGSIIVCSNTTVFDTVGLNIDRQSTAAGPCYVDVLRLAEDGSATRIWASGDIFGQIADTGSAIFTEFSMPGIIGQAGERYLVRLRNRSPSGEIRLQGIRQSKGPVDTGAYWGTASSGDQATYTSAQMSTALADVDVLPWAMLAAKNMAQTDQSFSDDFNRHSLGGFWVRSSNTGNQLVISGNRATFSGLSDGYQAGLYIRPTAHDASKVEANLRHDALALTNPPMGVMLHCSRDLSQVVYLWVTNQEQRIYSGPAGALTQRAAMSWGGGGFWGLYYDEPLDKYVALKNGEPTGLEWTAGNLVQHGPDFRYGGIRISRSNLFNAGQIDNWTLRDWIPPEAAAGP